jgi:hypothetical protein
MRRMMWVLVLASVVVVSVGAYAQLSTLRDPSWAFQVIDPAAPPSAEETAPLRVPGSAKTYTRAQIADLAKTWLIRPTGSQRKIFRSRTSLCVAAQALLPVEPATSCPDSAIRNPQISPVCRLPISFAS